MNRPTRHSYSSISTWEECAARYAYSYIYKLPQGSSAAMERGSLLHKMAEDYVNAKVPSPDIPYDLRKVSKQLNELRSHSALTERTWLLDRGWRPTQDTGSAWVKGIVDVHYLDGDTLHIRDHKSGREYSSHFDQLELYGIMGLLCYPQAKRADTGAIYIDGGFSGCDGSIIRPMLPKLIDKWDRKIKMVEADQAFIAKPGASCKWCPYSLSKGGPCADSARAGQ